MSTKPGAVPFDSESTLRGICGDSAKIVTFAPDDGPFLDEVPVDSSHGCTTKDDVEVSALIVLDDPSRELVNRGDGIESGDGLRTEWAVRKLGENKWVALIADFGFDDVDEDVFASLEDEGYELGNNQ